MKVKEYTKILEHYLLKDKRVLRQIKIFAVEEQNFELAAQTRSFEKANFPEEVEKELLNEISKIRNGLSMCGIKVDIKTAYHIDLAMDAIKDLGPSLDLKTGAKIEVIARNAQF